MDATSAPISTDGVKPILVRDKIPMRLWLATGAGMMERAAYYGSMIMTRQWALKLSPSKWGHMEATRR